MDCVADARCNFTPRIISLSISNIHNFRIFTVSGDDLSNNINPPVEKNEKIIEEENRECFVHVI